MISSCTASAPSKRIAIVQSNYIPWKGYFDLMRRVDEFVLFDDVQYTKNDWRNRNLLKTPHGLLWLTIPVSQRRLAQTIAETQVAHSHWRKKHWQSWQTHYGKAPFFDTYRDLFEPLYRASAETSLSRINDQFITAIKQALGITTRLRRSSEFVLAEDKNQRLIRICQQAGATQYLSGPAARSYLDEAAFQRAGITVRWMDYHGYPEYPQFHPPFVHGVSVLDLLFHVGPAAPDYLLPV